jgi:hypothetical protein
VPSAHQSSWHALHVRRAACPGDKNKGAHAPRAHTAQYLYVTLYSKRYARGGPGVCVLHVRQHAKPPLSGSSSHGPGATTQLHQGQMAPCYVMPLHAVALVVFKYMNVRLVLNKNQVTLTCSSQQTLTVTVCAAAEATYAHCRCGKDSTSHTIRAAQSCCSCRSMQKTLAALAATTLHQHTRARFVSARGAHIAGSG